MTRAWLLPRAWLALGLAVTWATRCGCSSLKPVPAVRGMGVERRSHHGAPICKSSPNELICEYTSTCRCTEPGCFCSIEWTTTQLWYGHMDVSAVEVEVNVSCASIRRPGALMNSVRVIPNLRDERSIELLDGTKASSSLICVSPHEEANGFGDGVHGMHMAEAHNASQQPMCGQVAQLVPVSTLPSLRDKSAKQFKLDSLEIRVRI